jgi:uncharacterized membrane protein YhaH (DUF805 family)
MKCYLRVLHKYDILHGRTSRKEFWEFILYNLIFISIAILLDNILGITAAGLPYGILNYLYILGVLIPIVTAAIRRLHDVGRSGWYILVALLPVVGFIWLIILFCAEGSDGENKFGDNPNRLAMS